MGVEYAGDVGVVSPIYLTCQEIPNIDKSIELSLLPSRIKAETFDESDVKTNT